MSLAEITLGFELVLPGTKGSFHLFAERRATRRDSVLFSPLDGQQVAATIVKGLKAGDFCITFGFEGYFVGLGTAGFAPCFSVTQAVCQVRRRMSGIEQRRTEQSRAGEVLA